VKCGRRLPVLRHLPDGSFLSLIGGVKVRVITASVTMTCHDGTTYGDTPATVLDNRPRPLSPRIEPSQARSAYAA